MYQWASTLTHQGQNMPFALPLQTDALENGFEILFLKGSGGGITRVAKNRGAGGAAAGLLGARLS